LYRILVSGMAYDDGKSGIAGYIEETVRELSKHHSVEIILLKKDAEIFPVGNIKITTVPDCLGRPFVNMVWHLFILPVLIFFKRFKYDFVFLPAGNRRVMSFYPVKTIVTVHDLSQFHVFEKYDRFRMIYIKKVLPFFLKKAHAFISVSENTMNDMLRYYKIPREKITVLYNGYRSIFKEVTETKVPQKDYILYVARVEHPGKNHLNLVKAYELMDKDLKNRYDLVFAGSLKERSSEVVEYVNRSESLKDIRFLGFVNSEDLPALYKNASLFVFPSFYEGFGIPLIEAMAAGIPVAASDRSSLPEIGGDAAQYFDPDKPDKIRTVMESILKDKSKKKEMIEKGFNQIEKFDWARHSEGIIKVYEASNGKG